MDVIDETGLRDLEAEGSDGSAGEDTDCGDKIEEKKMLERPEPLLMPGEQCDGVAVDV